MRLANAAANGEGLWMWCSDDRVLSGFVHLSQCLGPILMHMFPRAHRAFPPPSNLCTPARAAIGTAFLLNRNQSTTMNSWVLYATPHPLECLYLATYLSMWHHNQL